MKRRHGLACGYHLHGFTLIEQILAVALMAVLACMAVPALGHLMNRSQLLTAQWEIIAALQATRGLAVHTGRRAMLCPTRDGQHCSDELRWEGGWLSGHYRRDRPDQLDGAPSLVASGHERLTILSTAGRKRIRFQPDGSASGSNVTFTLCPRGRTEGALVVVLSNAGRAYGTKATAVQAQSCAIASP